MKIAHIYKRDQSKQPFKLDKIALKVKNIYIKTLEDLHK